jgi:hypothetical protein
MDRMLTTDTDSGYSTTVTLPPTLAPGDYLVRHEIIALHRAATQGEAEFYPSCTQLRVSGAGTATPAAGELVKFPGAYAATDKGILVDVFSPPVNYVMPGPALSKLAVSGDHRPAPRGERHGRCGHQARGARFPPRVPLHEGRCPSLIPVSFDSLTCSYHCTTPVTHPHVYYTMHCKSVLNLDFLHVRGPFTATYNAKYYQLGVTCTYNWM